MKTIAIDGRLIGRGTHSGVQEYASHIIEGVIAAAPNDKFRIFYNGFNLNAPKKLWLSQSNVRVVNWHVPNKALNLAFAALNWPKVDARLQADIFFSPHIDLVALDSAPHVMTFHDLSFLHYPQFFPFKLRAWHAMQLYKKTALGAAKIIADSEFTKNDIVKLLDVMPGKISVVYPGIDKQFKKLGAEDTRLIAFKNARQLHFPFALYLGTLEPRKNIPALIRAWDILKQDKKFSDLRLIIAGAPGWLYEDIIVEARKARFAEQIIFWGAVETEERVLLYNLSSVFVYPSFFEGFGLPPLEAQACGIPVVAASRTSLPETLNGSAMLVDPWRVADMADNLRECLTNTALREQMAAAGLKNSGRFSWQDAAHKTLQILHDASK